MRLCTLSDALELTRIVEARLWANAKLEVIVYEPGKSRLDDVLYERRVELRCPLSSIGDVLQHSLVGVLPVLQLRAERVVVLKTPILEESESLRCSVRELLLRQG